MYFSTNTIKTSYNIKLPDFIIY